MTDAKHHISNSKGKILVQLGEHKELETLMSEAYQIGIIQKDLLSQAMTHKSYANEKSVLDNERLEFLGDSLVNMAISFELFQTYPDKSEGELSKMRAHLINEKSLCERAILLKLDQQIRLGVGELKSLGAKNPRLLASTFEALLAVVYLDQGFEVLKKFILDIFQEDIQKIQQFEKFDLDFKTQFQETVQKKYQTTPVYQIRKTASDQTEVEVFVQGESQAIGVGKNRKQAEQDAAKNALQKVGL